MPAQRDFGVRIRDEAPPGSASIAPNAPPQGVVAKAAAPDTRAESGLLQRFLDCLMRALAPWPI